MSLKLSVIRRSLLVFPILSVLFVLLPFALFAQYPPGVYWASEVRIATSARNASGPYSPEQLLGKPNILSKAGVTNPCSWVASDEHDGFRVYDSSKAVRLVLGYSQPIYPVQIAIAENLNPGAIGRITLLGASPEEHSVVYDKGPQQIKRAWRMWNIFFPPPPFPVAAVELLVFPGAVPGWNEIDAVALATITDTVKPLINLVDTAAQFLLPENLGSTINTEYSELFPIIAPDGKTLYFCRRGDPRNIDSPSEDIWVSHLQENGQWSPAANIGPPLNNRGINFLCSILPDGKTALVGGHYLSDGRTAPGISITRFDGQNWSVPKPVNIPGFRNQSRFVSYFLNVKGNVLLMAIENEKSYGGMDIFVSFLQPDSSWSEPMNIGPTVNTAGDEMTVFLAPDNTTLYFSSDGHNGYGETDLFVTRRLDDSWTRWSEPKNLGSVINSPGWDGYFSLSIDADYGYFVSTYNAIGREDIFRVRLLPSMQPQLTYLHRDSILTIPPILFELDKAELNEKAKAIIRNVAEFLKQNPQYNVLIIGHTDDLHTEAYNMELSRRRALAVARYLQELGIDKSRLKLVSRGETEPLVPNISERNRQLNRRVEIRLLQREYHRGIQQQ